MTNEHNNRINPDHYSAELQCQPVMRGRSAQPRERFAHVGESANGEVQNPD